MSVYERQSYPIHIHPINQWSIVRQANKKYQIKNHRHDIFAGWPTVYPDVGDDVVNLKEHKGEDVQWTIQETKAGSYKYRCV